MARYRDYDDEALVVLGVGSLGFTVFFAICLVPVSVTIVYA